MTESLPSSTAAGTASTEAARFGSWRVRAAWLGCVVASLLAWGCTAEPSRGEPAISSRAEAANAASPRRARPPRPTRGSSPLDSANADSANADSAARGPVGLAPTPSSLEERLGSDQRSLRPSRDARPFRTEASERGATTGAALAPGVNEEFDEDVLLDIDDALGQTDENAFATLFKTEKVLVDGELVRKEKSSHPDNCRRWRTLRARGYAPKSATSRHLDAGALVRCGCLEFLARAKPSRVSHVRPLLAGASPSTLPALVASASSPLALEARGRAVARGATLAEFLPGARVIPSELPGRLTITEPSSESTTILNAEVWGDINADEVEDVVLSVLNTSEDGTFFELRLIQVTRASPDAAVTVLGVLD